MHHRYTRAGRLKRQEGTTAVVQGAIKASRTTLSAAGMDATAQLKLAAAIKKWLAQNEPSEKTYERLEEIRTAALVRKATQTDFQDASNLTNRAIEASRTISAALPSHPATDPSTDASQKTLKTLLSNLSFRCDGLLADAQQLVKDVKTEAEAKDLIVVLNKTIDDILKLRRSM